jgi:hypothetical protein
LMIVGLALFPLRHVPTAWEFADLRAVCDTAAGLSK